MLRLKANKTSLYKLVGTYEALPPMRWVTITKAHRATDWRGGRSMKNWKRQRRIEAAKYGVEAGLAILVIVAAVCYAGYVIGPLIW